MDEDGLKALLEDVAAAPAYGWEAEEDAVMAEPRWDRIRRMMRYQLRRVALFIGATAWLYEVVHQAVRR